MSALLIYMMEVIVCSGVFMTLYMLLLERKVGFGFCRLYLLCTAIIAAIIPLLDIPVWSTAAPIESIGISVGELSPNSAIFATESGFNYGKLTAVIYLIGQTIYLITLVLQWIHIHRIAIKGQKVVKDGTKIIRTDENIASFSFFNTIYISSVTADEDLKIIIAHECSHIFHKHSWERLAMEIQKCIMWWNPFVWVISRRLTEVHEFEADSDVIRGGQDANLYVTTLLKHLFGYSPEIANGLDNSLTKKRLKMILKNNSGRYALLRKMAIIPVMSILLTLFSFTTKGAEAENVQQNGIEVSNYETFRQWVMTNIQCPEKAKEQQIFSTVVVSFKVGKDGKVKDAKIARSQYQFLSDEVMRVFEKAPNWKPIIENGEPVEVNFMLPICFKCNNDNRTMQNLPGQIVVTRF